MHNERQEKEIYSAVQIIMLITMMIVSLVVVIINRLLGWEIWMIPVIIVGLVMSWGIHIGRKLTERVRIYMTSIFLMFEVFYYAVNIKTVYDSGAIIVITVFLCAFTRERLLTVLATVSGLSGMAIHLMVAAGTTGLITDTSNRIRTGLQFILVILGAFLADRIVFAWSVMEIYYKKIVDNVLEENQRANNFLANVSHEIRTPINAVIGLSAVLENENLEHGIQENVTAISHAGHRVAEQIGDILDFTEIDMGKLSVNKESYMIASLVNDLLTQLSFTENYGLELVVDLESSVPAEMVGDESKIKKILWHLIGNGYKFTKTGGVRVHIYTVRRTYGVNLVIEVQDTGVGMNEDELEHVYEKFYQSDSGRSRTAGGLGLGLPIVYGFTEAMGGVLAIETKVGEGSLIRVSLPQAVVDDNPCFSVADRKHRDVGGFLGFMTTANTRIREYYMEMIAHLSAGLAITFYRVRSRHELEELVLNRNLTHLFVGTGEYIENKAYIDELAQRMNVAVVADPGFSCPYPKEIVLLPKPFYGVQVANFLNHAFTDEHQITEEKMSCPGLRALVVDDEPMNLLVARGIFETYGMIVSTVSSGQESIDICQKKDFDIIFMDHMMPGMDGVEAMKRLRLNASREKKELIIVALTANAISSAKEMFLSEGFDGFVPKPVEITDLERVLKHVLPKSAIVYSQVEPENRTQAKSIFGFSRKTAAEGESSVGGTGGNVSNAAGAAGRNAAGGTTLSTVGTGENVSNAAGAAGRNATGGSGAGTEVVDGRQMTSGPFGSLEAMGVNTDTGLHYCQKDEEFYRELLAEYARDAGGKAAEIQRYFDAGDWKSYEIKVHAVKSTSKMIGALALSETAKDLEMAAKGGDLGTIRSLHPQFIPEYSGLMVGICAFLGIKTDRWETMGVKSEESSEQGTSSSASEEAILEFGPAPEPDEKKSSSAPEEEILEFGPAPEPDEKKSSSAPEEEILEFGPASEPDEKKSSSAPEEEILEFGPASEPDEKKSSSAPEEEILEFGPASEPDERKSSSVSEEEILEFGPASEPEKKKSSSAPEEEILEFGSASLPEEKKSSSVPEEEILEYGEVERPEDRKSVSVREEEVLEFDPVERPEGRKSSSVQEEEILEFGPVNASEEGKR